MRSGKINLTKLEQVTPKDTFDITTPDLNVTARPTDNFIELETHKADVHALEAFAESVNRGGRAYAQYREIVNEEDEEEGKAGQIKGLKREEIKNKSAAFIRGYEQMEGKRDGVALLHADTLQLLEENKELLPAELEQKFSQNVMQKYVAGRSKDYIKGILPEAMASMHSMHQAHGKYLTEVANEKLHSIMNTNLTIDTERMIQESLGTDINQLTFDLATRRDYDDQREQWSVILPEAMRQVVDDNLAKMKEMGVPMREASMEMMKTIANLSVKWGMPELIKYAELPGTDGVIPISNPAFQQIATNAIIRAEDAHESILRGLDSKAKKKETEDREYLTNDFMTRMIDSANDVVALNNIRAELTTPENMKKLGDHYRSLLTYIEGAIANGGAFATNSDGVIKAQLFSKGTRLTVKDVTSNMHSLSDSDASHFMSMAISNQRHNEAQAKSGGSGSGKEANGRMFTALVSGLNSVFRTDDLGRIMDPLNYTNYQEYFWGEVAKYQKSHNYQYPVGEDFKKIKDNAIDMFPTVFMSMKAGKGSSEASAEPAKKSKPTVAGTGTSGWGDWGGSKGVNTTGQSKQKVLEEVTYGRDGKPIKR